MSNQARTSTERAELYAIAARFERLVVVTIDGSDWYGERLETDAPADWCAVRLDGGAVVYVRSGK